MGKSQAHVSNILVSYEIKFDEFNIMLIFLAMIKN